jgi:hypothetical protein
MNTDNYKELQKLRNDQVKYNMDLHTVKCKNINEYAEKQNTFYDVETNQMLYGIDSNTHALGVSNGTCNQINPMIYKNHYKCSSGVAGGSPCYKNSSDKIEGFSMLNNRFKSLEIIILFALLLLLIFGYNSK